MVRTTLFVARLCLTLVAAAPLGPHAVGLSAVAPSPTGTAPPGVLFADDFSRGLAGWDVHGEAAVRVRDSGDPARGPVLELTPNGDVLVLVRGSNAWSGVRVEGRMLFPTEIDNYLGLAYHARRRGARWDFGLIYVKGNDGYLQANPHRDFNVSRTLYPEFRVPLTGDAAVDTGRWQTFAFEVSGPAVHVYVGPGTTPRMTFDAPDGAAGSVGLQPRSVGGPVWVDDIVVRAIDRLSYTGPALPDVATAPEGRLTSWRLAGPFERTDDAIARRPSSFRAWTSVVADSRGAVVTGRDVDYHGPRTVAYYRTVIRSERPRRATLAFGTVDDLAVWVNGRFEGFVPRQDAAWFDAHLNPAHPGRTVPLSLRAGDNDVVVRVRGGVYASGGFFARVVDRP